MLTLWLMRRFVRWNWGNRCPDYVPGCGACEAWLAFDRLFGTKEFPALTTLTDDEAAIEWDDPEGNEWVAKTTYKQPEQS